MSMKEKLATGSRALHRLQLFVPILAGATLRERILACLGALVGIALTGQISHELLGHNSDLPLIVAPLGASAVILFAIPSSPLAQPWPIVGGNTISALVGVAVARFIHDPILAIGVAVSLAIAVMSLMRCLHPPGGAAALTAVIGGPAISGSGFLFPFIPVGLNSLILVVLGIAFHRLSRRDYPHLTVHSRPNVHGTLDPAPQERIGFQPADIDAALKMLDETFDIEPRDLARLLRQVELEAMVRSHAELLCRDIMSRDVVSVGVGDEPRTTRALLLEHNLRTLPVLGPGGMIEGTVGLRELIDDEGPIGRLMSRAVTAFPDHPAVALIPTLTDGRTHAVVIVDTNQNTLGLITQTDLLAALAQTLTRSTSLQTPSQSRGVSA